MNCMARKPKAELYALTFVFNPVMMTPKAKDLGPWKQMAKTD